jgi:rubrerythrin
MTKKKNKQNTSILDTDNDVNVNKFNRIERLINMVCSSCKDLVRMTTRDRDKNCPSCGNTVENTKFKEDYYE